MKKTIINIMAATGITLVIVAIYAISIGAELMAINVILQIFGANIVIHLGFLITRKFESQYAALEATADIVYMIAVLIIAGLVFEWFVNMSLWALIVMAVTVYLILLFLSMVRIQDDISEINKLLQKRNQI